tara:strand:+ start:148 stop:450 length:303 start_codon:yes stop_codon:yes gene_type:complete
MAGAISRYAYLPRINGGKTIGSSFASVKIRSAIASGRIDYTPYEIKQGQRLDHIAGSAYGDSGLWWVIAAASGIGWCLQVPPGTLLKIPTNLGIIYSLLG